METKDYIAAQVQGIASMITGLLSDVTEAEWRTRLAPGHNMFGFAAWHMPASQDWAVRVAVQGLPMLASQPEWAARGMAVSPVPFGMSAEKADAVALATTPAEVIAYAEAVGDHALQFLAGLDSAALDAVPSDAYRLNLDPTPGYVDEIQRMAAWPVWRAFAGPATGHVRGHLGELDFVKGLLRSAR